MNVPTGGRLLVYGATGYTGGLLAALARERGLAPIVAGRSRAKVEAVAARLGVEARVASVDDAVEHALAPHEGRCGPQRIAAVRLLDLDHVGTQVGELAGEDATDQVAREIEDAQSGKRCHSVRV